MLASTCFTRDELERYLHGRAEDELSDAIEVHLESCTQCEDTLCELDPSDDTLVRTLQIKGSGQTSTPAWVEKVASAPFDTGEQCGGQESDSTTEPPDELGDYELENVLGRGGMSVVFSARHKHLGREVALKVLLPTTQQHAVSRERFVREMKAVGGLDHPAIVRATDAGDCRDTLYLVMEQIDGVDLNRVSQCEGPLRVADACAIGIEVARGLTHAHEQGVVHRDIKPSNVMLDHHSNVKILDFGLARMQSAACDVSLQTTMGQLLGTLDYMAPEQANGSEVDARADIYALGATLFKLLAGVPPYGRSAEMPIIEFLNRLATHDAKSVGEHRDQLPGELVDLITAMVQRDPEQRVRSAEEVVERLQPFAAGADLAGLAASALAKTADSEENSLASVKASLTDFWTKPLDNAQQVVKPPMRTEINENRRLGVAGWAALGTAILSVVGLIAFTIVITLTSGEGEIRIESELDDVKIAIVDEKDQVDYMKVEQGTAFLLVRTGRYRIRLNSPSDGVEVTPQEVVVRKNKTTIATVRRIAAAKATAKAAPAKRDAAVAMDAQLQLNDAMAELALAKQQPDADPAAIKELEQKLIRLRALSRPIPTEPVYQGRTLADWAAQMRFERDEHARQQASKGVLELVSTLPDNERAVLVLEVGAKWFAWGTESLEDKLFSEIHSDARAMGSITRQIRDIDRQVASEQLVMALNDADESLRGSTLVLCADLRDEFWDGGWPTVLTALKKRAESDTGSAQIASQLTYAFCHPDRDHAAELLMAIDSNTATDTMLSAMIYATQLRKLEIPRERQLNWVGMHLAKVARPWGAHSLWDAREFGPFRKVDWNQMDDKLQADVNTTVRPLLVAFEETLESVADNPQDVSLQLEAAVKSYLLSSVIEQANLTGEAREQAVALLTRRLEQLLQFRAKHTKQPDRNMDTPAGVAINILLLTGEVPESIKQPAHRESGHMGERLAAASKALTPGITFRGGGRTMSSIRDQSLFLSSWYPYEVIAKLHNAARQMREAAESRARSTSRFRGPSSMASSLSGAFQANPGWRPDARLMLDYAATSAEAAELINDMFSARQFTVAQRRHPEFARAVDEFMESANNSEATELGLKLWKEVHADEEIEAKLLGWLESADPIHVRVALEQLANKGNDRDESLQRLRGEWAKPVAAAIDRIADTTQLTASDLGFLDALQDKAPRAASHALKYLTRWLDDPAFRAKAAEKGGPEQCVNILLRFPEQAQQIRAKVQKVVSDPEIALPANGDARALGRFLGLLPDSPE